MRTESQKHILMIKTIIIYYMHYLSIVTTAIIYIIIMMGLHYEYTHEEVTKSTATTVHALLLLQNSSDPMQ